MSGYGRFAMYYDRLTRNVPYRDAAHFCGAYVKDRLPGAEIVLDLMCGTGNLALEVAALGFDVIGIDASEDMLAFAVSKAPPSVGSVLFLNQRAEALDLYGTADACICLLDSLNHLPDIGALRRVISLVSLFLNPSGIFLFDINTLYKHRVVLADNNFVYEYADFLCLWRNALTKGDSVEITLDFFEKTEKNNYKRYSESFTEQYFSPETVRQLLKDHSFELMDIYDGDSFGGYTAPCETTQRLLFAARKEG